MTLAAPVPINWTVLQQVNASDMQSQIHDALVFFLDPPCGIYRQFTGQSIPNAAWTSVVWDTVDKDNDGTYSNSNPSRFTATHAGSYVITGAIGLKIASNTSSGVVGLRFLVNGQNQTIESDVIAMVGTFATSATAVLGLGAGDYVELQVYQATGAAQPTTGDKGAPRFTARWTGGI